MKHVQIYNNCSFRIRYLINHFNIEIHVQTHPHTHNCIHTCTSLGYKVCDVGSHFLFLPHCHLSLSPPSHSKTVTTKVNNAKNSINAFPRSLSIYWILAKSVLMIRSVEVLCMYMACCVSKFTHDMQ